MKALHVMLAIAVLSCGAVYADSMDGQAVASGNVVLWFSGTHATATFDGTFSLAGQLMFGEAVVAFSASGWARGTGSGDTATLDVEAWATFVAVGSTQDGEAIAVQGGLTLSGLSADTGGSSGSGTGDFFATVFLAGRQYHAQGRAEGSATGAFVVPKDPLSMELSGDGSFDLSGEMVLASPAADGNDSSNPNGPGPESGDVSSVRVLLPWDLEAWPEELRAQLLDILTKIAQPAEAMDSPADPT